MSARFADSLEDDQKQQGEDAAHDQPLLKAVDGLLRRGAQASSDAVSKTQCVKEIFAQHWGVVGFQEVSDLSLCGRSTAVDGPRLRDDVVHGKIPWLLRDFRQELHFPGDSNPFALWKFSEEPVVVAGATTKSHAACGEGQAWNQPDGCLYNLLNCNKLWFRLPDAVVTWCDLGIPVGHFDQFVLAGFGIKPRQQKLSVLGEPFAEKLVQDGFLLKSEVSNAEFRIFLREQRIEAVLECLVILRCIFTQTFAHSTSQGILGERWRHFT